MLGQKSNIRLCTFIVNTIKTYVAAPYKSVIKDLTWAGERGEKLSQGLHSKQVIRAL